MGHRANHLLKAVGNPPPQELAASVQRLEPEGPLRYNVTFPHSNTGYQTKSFSPKDMWVLRSPLPVRNSTLKQV